MGESETSLFWRSCRTAAGSSEVVSVWAGSNNFRTEVQPGSTTKRMADKKAVLSNGPSGALRACSHRRRRRVAIIRAREAGRCRPGLVAGLRPAMERGADPETQTPLARMVLVFLDQRLAQPRVARLPARDCPAPQRHVRSKESQFRLLSFSPAPVWSWQRRLCESIVGRPDESIVAGM